MYGISAGVKLLASFTFVVPKPFLRILATYLEFLPLDR